jgi:hypothetical protein
MSESSGQDTIRRVCAWCGGEMGQVAGRAPHRYPVTHGICDACSHILSNFKDVPLDQLIGRLDGPVMVVHEISGEVVAANAGAAAVFGQAAEDMIGLRGGVVVECIHSTESGGCGNTVHCSGCSIRRLVNDTTLSGDGVERTATYQYRVTSQGIRMQHYLISTEKIRDLILLRIAPCPVGDEARPE